jgi:Ni,Fe-hydrogenase maturation factor
MHRVGQLHGAVGAGDYLRTDLRARDEVLVADCVDGKPCELRVCRREDVVSGEQRPSVGSARDVARDGALVV